MVRLFERYLDDIGRAPLLTREEEAELARRSREGDAEARRRLVTSNLRFVVSVAREYRGRGVPMADLVNEGNIGLLRAAERFDESRGVRFVSYAHWWVRRAILQAIVSDRGKGAAHPWREVSLDAPDPAGGTTLQDRLEDRGASFPDEDLVREGVRHAVWASLADVPDREREVLRRYFGLDGGGAQTLGEVAEALGTSRERARQLKERALARLRAQADRHDLALHSRPLRSADPPSPGAVSRIDFPAYRE